MNVWCFSFVEANLYSLKAQIEFLFLPPLETLFPPPNPRVRFSLLLNFMLKRRERQQQQEDFILILFIYYFCMIWFNLEFVVTKDLRSKLMHRYVSSRITTSTSSRLHLFFLFFRMFSCIFHQSCSANYFPSDIKKTEILPIKHCLLERFTESTRKINLGDSQYHLHEFHWLFMIFISEYASSVLHGQISAHDY